VVVCGPTALQVLGVALPTPLEDWDRCYLAVRRGRPERAQVVTHRTVREPVAWHAFDGVRVCHPVDAWPQLRGAPTTNSSRWATASCAAGTPC